MVSVHDGFRASFDAFRSAELRVGRLTCCVCACDLGEADDPYTDPDCRCCLRREWAEEVDDLAPTAGEVDCPTMRWLQLEGWWFV